MSYDGRLLAGVTVLMAVVEAGSMTRAAGTLQLTPSGVGRAVESFTSRKLLETRILTVASPAYLATHSRPAYPSDLVAHECIDYRDPTTGRPFDWEFHRGKEVVPIAAPARLMVSDVETILEACVAGAGIAQVMALGSEHLLQSGELIERFPDWPGEVFPLYAIFPSRRHRVAKVRVFVDFCLQLLGNPGQARWGMQAVLSPPSVRTVAIVTLPICTGQSTANRDAVAWPLRRGGISLTVFHRKYCR
jgi:DNA-binding transcriptional LysR family regulator